MDRDSIRSLGQAYDEMYDLVEFGIGSEDPNSSIGISNPNRKVGGGYKPRPRRTQLGIQSEKPGSGIGIGSASAERFQRGPELDTLPKANSATDKDRKGGYYNFNGKKRYWDKIDGRWMMAPPTSSQIGGDARKGVDLVGRNVKRYLDKGADVVGGIYDKSVEAGNELIKQGARNIDAFAGTNTSEFVKNRQDAAKERQKELGGQTPSQLVSNTARGAVEKAKETLPGAVKGAQDLAGKAGDAVKSGVAAVTGAGSQAVDAVRDAVGGGGSGSSSPATTPAPKPAVQKAGLTPMQQWAKNFPKLAAKVKPGQAGFNEIQKMSAPAPQTSTPKPSGFKKPVGNAAMRAANIKQSQNKPIQRKVKPMANTPKLDQATTNVGKWNEETLLQSLTDAYREICEGLPEPKVHWKKDMDPYDPRRTTRDHAPGSPLPPGSYRPGLPDMRLNLVKKDDKKSKDQRKPKTA